MAGGRHRSVVGGARDPCGPVDVVAVAGAEGAGEVVDPILRQSKKGRAMTQTEKKNLFVFVAFVLTLIVGFGIGWGVGTKWGAL